MTLADKIMTERKRRGWSQEELAERVDVTRQSVSKWESGLSVPDLDKIVQLSKLFGVTCDYLLCEEAGDVPPESVEDSKKEQEEKQDKTHKKTAGRSVSREEAGNYMAAVAFAAPRIAAGVFLCIFGVALLMLFIFLPLHRDWFLPDTASLVLGLVLLILCVAVAVALFVVGGMRLSPYEYLGQDILLLPDEYTAYLRTKQEEERLRHIRGLVVGIVLCILSVLFLLIPALSDRAGDFEIGMGLVGLLCAVAVGACILTCTGLHIGRYNVLLQQGDYATAAKHGKKKAEAVQGIYWMVVTAGYLLYSFLTQDWGRSWVVWPVAAILSGGIDLLFRIKDKE